MYYIILHYITLHYIALHCITLHYITLHYITLHYITLHYIALHCIALHCIALHCIALHCIALHCIALHCITLHYITLHCIALHYIALHCITLHYITLHYITLHYITLHYITLHYITLHYRYYFKRHLHLKGPVVHQQLHVIRNTAHRPSTQASYTISQVRPKRKISCAAAQIAATLTISFHRWRHMSLTSYWGQQRMSLTFYPGPLTRCPSPRLSCAYKSNYTKYQYFKNMQNYLKPCNQAGLL